MKKPNIVVLTLFPELYPGPLGVSLLGKALEKNLWTLKTIDIKSFGFGPHGLVDDGCYGGGAGMVMRPDVVHGALVQAIEGLKKPKMIYMTPRGHPLRQSFLKTWVEEESSGDMVLLCGRYEGIDQRVLDHWKFHEISVSDVVMCGGDIPAMALIESYIRLYPGVLGNPLSLQQESFQESLLEHPLYTRPEIWKDRQVPKVLLSGHHFNIHQWQKEQSFQITQKRRPDLWKKYLENYKGFPHDF